VPWYPRRSWITCWRTRFRSAPSLASTWAATPSPSWISPQQDVLAPDVVVAQLLLRLTQRQLKHLRAGSEGDMALLLP
jgi:hypothetical protein